MVGTMGSIRGERPLGLFDRWADVDVYLLDFLKTAENQESEATTIRPSTRQPRGVAKRFAVHVGPVVPYRHKEVGPTARYIHARSLPVWGEHKRIVEKRNFSGRLFEPPFVAVRENVKAERQKTCCRHTDTWQTRRSRREPPDRNVAQGWDYAHL